MAVSWNGTGGEIEVALEDGKRDLIEYQALNLRAVVDPLSELNKPGEP